VAFVWRADPSELQAAWPARGRLRWIQAPSAGVERLLFPALVESDVVLTNARGEFDDAVAEWVFGATLALAKRLPETLAQQARSEWR